MNRFERVDAVHTNDSILALFEESRTLSQFCLKMYGVKNDSTAVKHARILAKEVNFDILKYDLKVQYSLHPDFCKNCNKELSYQEHKARKLFCTHSCSATYSNRNRTMTKRTVFEDSKHFKCYCVDCGKVIGIFTKSAMRKRCDCCHDINRHKSGSLFKYWLDGDNLAGFSSTSKTFNGEIYPTLKKCIKDYLLETNHHKCTICETSDNWNNDKLVFILDHIDGDWSNNQKDNLRLICPNCNSQLSTTKHKERGTGRRSQRVSWNKYKEKLE